MTTIPNNDSRNSQAVGLKAAPGWSWLDAPAILRFFAGIGLLPLAWFNQGGVFLGVAVLAFLLDAIDGPIARHLGRASAHGARIDSVADFTVYVCLCVGAWWLWPAVIRRESTFVIAALAAILVPVLVGLIRFHALTSYHTWMVKIATVCIAPASLLMLMGGPAWPFRIATAVAVVAAIEQIIITLLIDTPRSDVHHVLAIWRRKNS